MDGQNVNRTLVVPMLYTSLHRKLQEFIYHRLEHYFDKRPDSPAAGKFRIPGNKKDTIGQFIRAYELSGCEQLILSIALIPHLDPECYSNLIQHFLPQGGDLPIFGGTKSNNHRGIIPTGETVQFILAGTDYEERIQVMDLIRNTRLNREGVLILEPVQEGDPEMSGKLLVAQEFVDLLLTGKPSVPSFGPDFPAQLIKTQRDWSDLILTEDVREQINELKTWVKYKDQLMLDWKMGKKLKPGYRVLFYGPPGTGKTLTATLLGKYTGQPVFRVDLSTIVSKYIGETEKNLEKLFARAQNKNWILFFDEADALFGKRTEVSDAHDRYANQEVSYLLQRVENFEGLVILSTNYKANIDEAFLRRFNAIIKFPFPDAKQRHAIWEKSLPENVTLEENLDISSIASRYKLTGGNIINAVQQALLKIVSENKNTITLDSILHGIKREVEKEGKVFTNLLDRNNSTNGTA